MRFSLFLAASFLFFLISSCKNKDKQPDNKSENNIDAARNFIRAALDGKFTEARNFMLEDSVNTNYMDVAERSYQRADQTIKDGYRSSSINIVSVKETIKDSVTVVTYSNSFKNDPDTLKVIKSNGQWLVDFKYLYLHNADTLHVKEIINDKIK
ncbi:MAG: DUF4878 domain-containing protein [Chitinophagaceae bacterium]|nr:DUF4878 domain-containing protein [Chitinophagaceae bacterium]